jgi:hypothetical protein
VRHAAETISCSSLWVAAVFDCIVRSMKESA